MPPVSRRVVSFPLEIGRLTLLLPTLNLHTPIDLPTYYREELRMSASIKVDTEPHSTHPAKNGKPANNGRSAEKGPLSESAVTDEIQPAACLESPAYFARKALVTRVLGALLLIPASPLIVLLVVLTRCTSSGPGLFRQTRRRGPS